MSQEIFTQDETQFQNFSESAEQSAFEIEALANAESAPLPEQDATPEKEAAGAEINESEYNTQFTGKTEGVLRNFDGRFEILIQPSNAEFTSLLKETDRAAAQAAINLCAERGHSIWVEETADGKIYTEFKMGEGTQVEMRIYKTPDKHIEDLLKRQMERLMPPTVDALAEGLPEPLSKEFIEQNQASMAETGISIDVGAQVELPHAQNTVESRVETHASFVPEIRTYSPEISQAQTAQQDQDEQLVDNLTAEYAALKSWLESANA